MIIGGPILGAIVLIAALVVLADTLHKYANGEAGLLDVAFAALDCIPGMKGLTSLRGLAKGLKGLKGGMKAMSKGLSGLKSARSAIADGAKGAYNRLKSMVKGCGDPVDPATGQMYMAETDIMLPGTLPLLFTRRVASDYHTGGWFGPSWASTIDQRLEIDEHGVVLITEDGMLLAYPHPEVPETPVFTHAGPRWPMIRLDNGGYRVTDPRTGLSRRFAPPQDGLARLERISDRNHNFIDFDYDADGAPFSIRHSGGYHLRLVVDKDRVTVLSLAGAAEDGADLTIKRYGYTEGNLTSVTNSSGLSMRFTYDDRLRITSWTDTNNSRYDYNYDDQDRCISQGGEAGHVTNLFAYDGTDSAWPGCRVTAVTTGEGFASHFVINDNCQVIAEISPLGDIVRKDFDSDHHLTSFTDELGHTTRYQYDNRGQVISVLRPDGHRVISEYNDLGLPTVVAGPDGTAWRQEYDARGNRIALVDPTGATTCFTYDAAGRLMSIADALGRSTEIRSDHAGMPLQISNALGEISSYRRDAFGRPTSFTDALGRTTRMEWTVEGLPTQRIESDGSGESWTYDGEGNCTSHTDAAGAVTRFDYTHFDLLTARTGPDGMRYEFAYDTELRLTRVSNPKHLEWTYTYDGAGRLICESDFDGRTISYSRDPVGRMTARTNALGQTVAYERDALGRISRKDADGQVTSYTYSPTGQITHAVSPGVDLVAEHDRLGRPVSESINGHTMTHEFDVCGQRTRRTTPTLAVTEWSYDAAGRHSHLITAGTTIGFNRDPAGQELNRRIADALTLTNEFDGMGRLTNQGITTAAGRSVQRRSYAYRPDGNLVRLEDQLNGTRYFDLDTAGRVTAVRAENWAEQYAYDEVGNQTEASWPASHPGQEATGPRGYTGNRITRAGNVRYEHDAQGRITLRQKSRLSRKPETWRYTWDAEDRLTAVTTPDGTLWRYLHDPHGRRVAKQRVAPDGQSVIEETTFAWDGVTLCEQTTSSPELSRPVTLTWEHQGLRPIAQTERVSAGTASQDEIDSRFFAIVTDLVGAPTELLDEHGDIAWRARATLWGSTAWAADSVAYTPLRFPGQYYDPETGLHYNHFRTYDPETARYLSPDPLGLAPAPNPVSYVSNPLTWADPLGLAPSCDLEIEYGTPDIHGRPTGATARIGPNPPDGGKAVRRMKPPGFGGEAAGHSRGHLIPKQLGGPGNEPRNFVTQDAAVNNGPQSDFEDAVAAYVKGDPANGVPGNEVIYVATPRYSGSDPIPSRVDIDVYGDNGWYMGASFMNSSTT
ncbi:RHS repeat-associated core domain-containing protein [Streptomyces sp. NPDC059900]